jgi:hypothetical protein
MQDYKTMMRAKGRLLPLVEQVAAKEAASKNYTTSCGCV